MEACLAQLPRSAPKLDGSAAVEETELQRLWDEPVTE
jgi:hypothetical protein